jgi:hypothetical protein
MFLTSIATTFCKVIIFSFKAFMASNKIRELSEIYGLKAKRKTE